MYQYRVGASVGVVDFCKVLLERTGLVVRSATECVETWKDSRLQLEVRQQCVTLRTAFGVTVVLTERHRICKQGKECDGKAQVNL